MKNIMILLLVALTYINASVIGATKGEFAVNQGSANYSLEIITPKGTAGLKPSLSFSYNSSNNFDGVLGVGFSLNGLSQITKCNQRLFSEKKDSSRNYNFCLDGQKLLTYSNSSTYGSNTRYITEINNYSKILKESTGWTVYTKDGLIYQYGKTTDSKDLDVSFRVNKIKDRYGNEINFKYDSSTKNILQITYANNKIDFFYKNREDSRTIYNRTVPINFSKKLLKVSIKTNNTEISSYTLSYLFGNIRNIEECINSKCLEKLNFEYSGGHLGFVDNTNKIHNDFGYAQSSNTSTNPRMFIDTDLDGYQDILFFGNDGVYISKNNGNGTFNSKVKVSNSFSSSLGWGTNHPRLMLDINKDFLPDIIGFAGDGVYISKNLGNNTFSPPQKISNFFGAGSGWNITNHIRTFVDLNADGLADIVGFASDGVYVSTNTGNFIFSAPKRIITSYGYSAGGWRSQNHIRLINDVNADGLPDIIGFGNSSISVSYNKGNNSFSNPKAILNDFSYNQGWRVGKHPRSLIDINADGYPDIVGFDANGVYVSYNKGDGTFLSKVKVINDFGSNHGWLSNYTRKLVDLNNDGLPDILGYKNDGIYISYNEGSNSFRSKIKVSSLNWTDSKILKILNDTNADGIVDLSYFNNGIEVLYGDGKFHKLTKITNNKNQTININYSDLRDSGIYSSSTNLTYPKRTVKSSPMKVVKSFTINDGAGGANTTNYTYKNFSFDIERGSLGFGQITAKNIESDSKSIVNYNQVYPYIGMVTSSYSYLNNTLVSKNVNYFAKKISGNNYQVYNNKNIAYNYNYDSNNLLTTKTTIKSQPDIYGNIPTLTTITLGNSETFKKIITNSYDNYDSTWILSRLKNSKVTHTSTGNRSVVRKSSFEYNSSTGTLTKEIIEPGNSKALTKTYSYNSNGNKVSETISGAGITTTTTKYQYDSYGINQTKVINPLNQSETRAYDIRNQLISLTGPNGLTTKWQYDKMGRKTKETRADGNYTTWTYAWSGDGHKVTEKINGKFPVTVYYDSLGRKVKTEKIGFDGKTIFEEIEYDNLGRKIKTSTPYFEDESPEYIEYEYDEANRLVKVESPAPDNQTAVETIEYNGFTTIKTNAKGQTKTTEINAIEKVVRINDGSTIEYEYDAVGNLIKTTDAKNNEILISYDIFGNKISQNDPDLGKWTYKYNSLKQLVSQTDANGNTTTFTYDKLGRVTKKVTKEGTLTYQYDVGNKAIGKINKEVGIGVTKEYTYDNYGRNSQVKTTIEDKIYTQKVLYDSLGRVSKTVEPNNITITNNYNNYGYLESITTPKLNATSKDKAKLIAEMNYDIQEYLKNKKLAVEYQNQIIEYESKVSRYKVILDIYKNDTSAGAALDKLKNHVDSLIDLIDSLQKLADDYNARAVNLNLNRNDEWLDFIEDADSEIFTMYNSFGSSLVEIAQNSLSFLEELKAKEAENKHLLYCGQIGGISVFCPDKMTNSTITSYDTEDNILFYGTSVQIVSYYEKALKDLEGDLSYIKDLRQKQKYYKQLSNAYQNRSSAYNEIANSDLVYFYKVLEQNSFGVVTSYLSGNGLETKKEFDSSGTLNKITTGYDSGDEIRNLTFKYDILSNVINKNDEKLQVEHDFIYDSLNRLKYANINTKDTNSILSYNYDELGNITYKSDVGYYSYATSRPHAVSKVGNNTYTYDANGNMTKNADKTITYTSFNKPNTIKTASHVVRFKYDANNSRFKKTSNSDTTHYIGKSYEKNFYANGSVQEKYFIYAGGKLVSIFSQTDSQYDVKYLHYDNLGSIDTITNYHGLVVDRMAYKPFGKQLNLDKYGNEPGDKNDAYSLFVNKDISSTEKKLSTNRGYTGHEHIKEAGFIHMNGRVYDPIIGRFLSADPHIQDSKDSQSYNRYSYVKNNPYKYTDPSGFFWKKIKKAFKKYWKAIVTIAAVAVVTWLTAGTMTAFVAGWGTSFGTAAGFGALTTTTLGSIVAGALTGAVAGFAGGLIGSVLNGGSLGDGLQAGLTGAVFGAIGGAVAGGIGGTYGHESSFLNGGGSAAVKKSILHGISRAAINKAQGGRWSSGFWSGFLTSGFSPGTTMGGSGSGGFALRTAISGVIGGTASEISGGKFANGAVSGAFVHMFNAEDIITMVGGGLQIIAGTALLSTGWLAPAGVMLIAHGSNNMYEGYTGDSGLLRDIYDYNVGKGYYKYFDVGISAVGAAPNLLARTGSKVITNYYPGKAQISTPVYKYQTTAGKLSLGIETYLSGRTLNE